MNRTRALSFAFAALTGLISGLPLTIHADDTEIYVGSRTFTQAVTPNVLLILDTSGSMAAYDGQALDRLDRVKVALKAILDDVNNMNIGLARFHTPGGPILFPVANVDADAQDVELGLVPEIEQRLVGSANDAEQLGVGSATVLDSTQLEMTATASFGNEVSTMLSVEVQSSNDAEESLGGTVNTVRTVMDCCANLNGLRFENVPIPANAPILSARIEFVASATNNVPTSMTFYGHATTNSSTFTTAANDLSGRPSTAATVTWSNVPEWSAVGDRFLTPNLKSIVQEIVGPVGGPANGWAANNALSILFNGTGDRQVRTFDYSGTPANSAQLIVEYGDPVSSAGDQIIGLRFEDVRVPQHQGIKSAVIEFVPTEDATAAALLEIHGQDSDDSAPFTTAVNDITSRPATSNKVQWNVPVAAWKEGVSQATPDLSAIVQEIVDRPGWCGGNAMAFGIDDLGPAGPAIARSFDGDPSLAPVLRIDFDTTQPPGAGEGCTVQEVSVRPGIATDDVNQIVANNALDTPTTIVQMDDTRANGLRFPDLDVPPGVKILDARLVFTATGPGPNTVNPPGDPVTLSFTAQAVDTAPPFSSGPGTDVLTRTSVGSSVTWSPPVWTPGDTQMSPNLSTVIDDVVNNVPGWASGNDLAILVSSSGSGSRIAESQDSSPGDSPQLRITMEVNVGDLPSVPVVTVRQRLKQVVDQLTHNGTTPIVDNLYEAASYFRGEAVTWGLNRGTSGNTLRRTTRVSHPASYAGGTVVRAAGCTDANLDAQACVTENSTGSPDYISPIETECQANFIVLLTDGIANRNSSTSLIQSLTGLGSCSSTLPPPPNSTGGSVSNAEQCGLELSEFLNDPANDQNTSVPGPNTVTTYTIGLNISNEWLKQVARLGGGEFYEASSTAQLRKTFNDITSDILQRTASFATPSLSVNSFNRLFHLDEVYFSFFEPQQSVAWPGNVKKYRLCTDPNLCGPGDILDVNDDPAIGTNGRVVDTAQSFWLDPNFTQRPDGPNVLFGGAGNAILTGPPPARHVDRRVFTFTDLSGPPPLGGVDLAADGHEIKDDDDDGILDGITVGTEDEKLQQTKDLLGWPGNPVNTLTASERAQLVTELNTHIQWVRGQDVDDEIPNGDTDEDRYSFSDPLHSSAVAFTMGGDVIDPVTKVVVGTNDGGIRVINGFSGVEEFIFYPQSTLRRLADVRSNPTGPKHYGVDGTATVWLNDIDNDGVIEEGDGDFVRLFIGQRRGGNEIYSLEITPKPGADPNDPNPVDSINPVYHWRIRGGGTEYPRLGQTWSRPKLATVALANTPNSGDIGPRTALLFAGGYDDSQDNGFGPGGLGNAIYMADPYTGERWLSVSSNDPGSGDRVIVPDDPLQSIFDAPKMTFPIPSELALVDTNADGNINRILVGDVGGQLWRVDLTPADPNVTSTGRVNAVVGRLGLVSNDQTLVDQRKFFEPPDVIQVRGGTGFSSVANYDMVTIVSGDRANPLSFDVQDRFFAFRDTVIGLMADDGLPLGIAGDGNADNFTTLKGALDSPLDPGDLFDVTNIVDPQGTDLTNLQNANGYYINLVDLGEKGLSSPITLEGKVFFTTYLPDKVVSTSACQLLEGSGVLYAIDVLNGTAVFNFDGSLVTDPLSLGDRRLTLGAGIPSSAVPIFNPNGIPLLIGGSGGATVIDLGIKLPKERTFWFEETGL